MLGAAAGYGLSRWTDEEKERKANWRDLRGALAGAALANLGGDRYRRYLANAPKHLGYNAAQMSPAFWKQPWPEIKRRMIDDLPADRSAWNQYEDLDRMSRRSIFRHAMGLPVRPEEDMLKSRFSWRGLRSLYGVDMDSPYWNEGNAAARKTWEGGAPRMHMLGRYSILSDAGRTEVDSDAYGFPILSGPPPSGVKRIRDNWDFATSPGDWKLALRPKPEATEYHRDMQAEGENHVGKLLARVAAQNLLLVRGGAVFDQEWDASGKPVDYTGSGLQSSK